MVTQQILVLFFLVRIRVAQQINEEFDVSDSFFVYSQCYSFDSHPVFRVSYYSWGFNNSCK